MKKVLFFSDTHIGSTVGLWPDGVVSQSGHELPQSRFQKWLWECWNEAVEWARKSSEYDELIVVFGGDLVEGNHHRTNEIMSARTEDQFDAALQVFEDLNNKLKPDQFFMIRGTECHSRETENAMGNILGAVVNPETGQAAFDYLKLDIDGIPTSFAHHVATAQRKHLQASAHSIAVSDEMVRAAECGHTPSRVICRAHRHEMGIWDTGRVQCVINGAWQGLTRFGHKVVPGALSMPSMIMLEYAGGWLPKIDYIAFRPDSKDELIKV